MGLCLAQYGPAQNLSKNRERLKKLMLFNSDFTLTMAGRLLRALKKDGRSFTTLKEYFNGCPDSRICILRHDVDKKPGNSMGMARLEAELGITGTYYFRSKPCSMNEKVIEKIGGMGHEIGYHYENLTDANGDYEKAIDEFESVLERLRKLYPVKTICMHGSPLSKYDNKKIWEKYDYRDYGIIAEPYFDVDYDEIFYITDTGRSWNHSNASIRDKVNSKFDITIKDTQHLIKKIQNNELPDKIMINVHPQRWNDKFIPWVSELIRQNVKNVVKKWINSRAKTQSR